MITIDTPTDKTDEAAEILRILRSGVDQTLFETRLARAVTHGYRMIIARTDNRAVAVLGFRIVEDIFWGRTLFVDDLVTRPEARSLGVGTALLSQAKEHARALNCDHIRLCSGLTREDAHRFYEANGMERYSIQFAGKIEKGNST